MESETLRALRQKNAEALLSEIKDKVQPGQAPDALELYQWLVDRMYQDARGFARAARLEQESA